MQVLIVLLVVYVFAIMVGKLPKIVMLFSAICFANVIDALNKRASIDFVSNLMGSMY